MKLTFSADVISLNPDLSIANRAEYRVKSERLLIGDGFDSQLERDWCDELKARGCEVRPHGWTFHLPGGVDYTPDMIACAHASKEWCNGFILTVYEVKGNMHQKNARDSRTRFKIAAGLYPCFRFVWVTRYKSGAWRETRV